MIYSGNRWLSMPEMTTNAEYILDYLTARGWTKNAICGMLGNMQTESTINPSIWQDLDYGDTQGGYGLVQWTPATKYINWCNARGLKPAYMTSNLKRILFEVDNNIQWGNDSNGNPPPFNFKTFTKSTLPASDLGLMFLRYYERPGVYDQPIRGEQAQAWYETLTGGSGESPYHYESTMKFALYLKRRL